uniref:Uncharacterized protein n=1 Tax=Lynx canadensis TaxID=61383 RepID=A0A667HJB1_LYNCA
MHGLWVGAGATAKKELAEVKCKKRRTVLAEDHLAQMPKQLDVFKTNQEEFAGKHKQEILEKPEFLAQFQDTCALLGWILWPPEKGFILFTDFSICW